MRLLLVLGRLLVLAAHAAAVDVQLWWFKTRARLIGGRKARRMLREGRQQSWT